MNRSALAFLLLLTACPGGPTTVDCTTEARSSITLTVVDPDGADVPDATATYSVDGSADEDCESFGTGGLACGWELAGTFEVTVTAPGFAPSSFTQVVEADECHVITESVEHTLQPLDCTDEALPSIRVTVTDSQGAQITSADVSWNVAAEDDLNDPCTPLGGNVWTCGEEVAGELAVEITNAGPYEPYRQTVTVTADACHVLTEELDAVLQYLPD